MPGGASGVKATDTELLQFAVATGRCSGIPVRDQKSNFDVTYTETNPEFE